MMFVMMCISKDRNQQLSPKKERSKSSVHHKKVLLTMIFLSRKELRKEPCKATKVDGRIQPKRCLIR